MELDRRHFIGGSAAAILAAAGTAGLVGCTSSSGQTSSNPETSSETSSNASPHSWESTPDPIPEDEITETVDTEVVVIGAGIAGLTCAHSAAMNGAQVILVEKMEEFSARGHDNGVVGSAYQKNQGIEADIPRMRQDYLQLTTYKTNINLWNVWASHSGEAMDYYAERMNEEGVTEFSMAASTHMDSDNVAVREYPTGIDFGVTQVTDDGENIQHRFLRFVEQWAKDEGAEFRYSTKAERLIRDEDGPVTGVICSTENGYVKINASKGVVLATGDISGNDDMLKTFAPIALSCEDKLYTPFGGNEGDGINLACWVGGAPQKTNAAIMALPSAKAKGGPLASDGILGWLGVNMNGERYFAENSGGPSICFATMQQPEAKGYSIFDGKYEEKILVQAPDGKNRSGIDYLGDLYGVSEGFEGLQDWMDKGKEDGTFFEAETLDELATTLGIDPETLKSTVDEYNALCEKGVDEAYGKPGQYLTTVDTPPFYASKIKAAVLVVPFGVNVNSHSQVCDADDKAIENLYAIGNVQGNFFTDSYPMLFPGISHGRALKFGWVLGKALAEGKLI